MSLRASSRFSRADASETSGNEPKRDHLFFAGEVIAEAPQLASVRSNKEMQTIAIGELVRLLFRLRILNGERCESIWVRPPIVKESYPESYP